MKKFIINMIFIFSFLCSLTIYPNVKAINVNELKNDESWAFCQYNAGNVSVTYYYNKTTDTFEEIKGTAPYTEIKSNISKNIFINSQTKKLNCPNLYYKLEGSGRQAIYNISSTKKDNSYHEITSTANSKVNNIDTPNTGNNNTGNSNTSGNNSGNNTGNTTDNNGNIGNNNEFKDMYAGNTTCGGITYFKFNSMIPDLTSTVYNILKIAVPLILIIKGMLDMFKAMSASKEDEMAKSRKKFVTRLIAGACAFFVFLIVETVVSWVADRTDNQGAMDCVNCFLNGSNHCDKVN